MTQFELFKAIARSQYVCKAIRLHLWSAFQIVYGVSNGKPEVIDESMGSGNRIMISD